MGYPGPQTYQQAPANNQQMPINMHAVAKWHIPQSAQQANCENGDQSLCWR